MTELDIKTERISNMLQASGLGAVLMNSQHNFAWLTGGGSNGIDLSRENGAASLLVTREGKRYVLANNIEMPRMLQEELSADDFEPIAFSWQAEKANGETALLLARDLISSVEIATDIPLFAGVSVIEGKIAPCRYSMTPTEIERYRELGRDAGAAMGSVIAQFAPGETENTVATKIRSEMGAKNITSVVTLVAADERVKQFRHPIPTEKAWNKTLLMVTCAKRFGQIVSLSRLICSGAIPDEVKRKTDSNAFVNATMANATRPGTTGAELYEVTAAAYAERGFAGEIDLHHQGGPTGYKTREWVAHPKSSEVVNLDQAFAWNPTITGTKVEETFITTESGLEIITATVGFPQIMTTVAGRDYLSPGILSI